MSRDYLPLYDGSIKANRIGTFTRDGLTIHIVRPGYDSQGRRRQAWTQFVIDGIPIYEVKMRITETAAIKRFNELWTKYITPEIRDQAYVNCRKERLAKFKDGVTGESPAPALSPDGRPGGKQEGA